jgi:dTDP-4-dehydrorhamnose 3,5-epimerase
MERGGTLATVSYRAKAAPDELALPHGVAMRPLRMHSDDRGRVGEIFRAEWLTGAAPLQWSMTASEGSVMRGVHLHLRHDDYIVVLQGDVQLGLRDLRPGSPTDGRSALVDLHGSRPAALIVPHGVAHGLLILTPAIYVLGASHYYDADDELGCHWQDRALELRWALPDAKLSARDAALPPLREVAPRVRPWRADAP